MISFQLQQQDGGTIRITVKDSEEAVDVHEVKDLIGVLKGKERGLFVSRSGFTPDAREYAARMPQLITLFDGV